MMELLSEFILVIGAAILMAALLPLPSRVRLVLSFCGLVLVTLGGALFACVAYPGETLLFFGAAAVTAGAARGYRQVIAWLTRRATIAITPSNSASEPDSKS